MVFLIILCRNRCQERLASGRCAWFVSRIICQRHYTSHGDGRAIRGRGGIKQVWVFSHLLQEDPLYTLLCMIRLLYRISSVITTAASYDTFWFCAFLWIFHACAGPPGCHMAGINCRTRLFSTPSQLPRRARRRGAAACSRLTSPPVHPQAPDTSHPPVLPHRSSR